ncbi:MAG: CHASE2 domain-containing protein [Acidobacteriota bacterium]
MWHRLRRFFLPERGVLLPQPYAVVAGIGVAIGLALALSDFGQRLEWGLYDRQTRAATIGSDPAPGVVVVAIDEPSFTEVGMPWPWPRSLHAALVDQLTKAGARSIAFDILFDVPAADPDDDIALAEAIGRAGHVVLAADRAVIDDRGYSLTQWSEPLPALSAHAAAVGTVRIPYDPDGVLRRAVLEDEGRKSLALAVAALDPGFAAVSGLAARPRLFRFNGEPRRGIRTASYYQALDPEQFLPPGFFEGTHVLVGRALGVTTIDEVADHFMTPVAIRMPGVEVHATIVDALLRDRFVGDPMGAPWLLAAWSALAAALVAAPIYRLGPVGAPAAVLAAILLLIGAGVASLAAGVRWPALTPSLTIAATYAVTAAYRYGLATRERRLIKRAFQHYVSPAIVQQMLDDPSKLRLGGEEYEVTVLFSDLEGFTTLSERVTPARLSEHLGEYFKEMLDVVIPQRGTLDKLIGDAIMAYFGCPIRDARHAADACRAALAMQERMVALNARWQREGLPRLRTRVGLNTGTAVAGNMGTHTIFNYTILGDCVNLASRLEGVNKVYGTLIIIGEDTWAQVRDQFEARELDWIRVKGKTRPVAIYELAAEAGRLDDHRVRAFRHFADGLSRYRDQRWTEAATCFADALREDPEDGPSRTFATRCEHYRAHPPEAWDGVAVMESK